MIELTARMIRSYKGAAASILLLFLAEQRPLTQGEMRRGTGYGDEAINDAVWMLREDGLLVETTRYTWTLPEGLRQLPIMAPELPAELSTGAVDNSVELAPDDPELALNESMNESIKDSDIDDSFIHSSASPSGAPRARSGNSGAATREKLAELGFYGRGLADMLKIPGLTMDEVFYHVEHAPNLGAALARIRARQPVSRTRIRDDPPGSEYISGEFGEFIEH